MREGLRYVRGLPELLVPFTMLAVIGSLSYNFSVTFPGQFPDQALPFQVKDVDGDGDFALASLTVGIDGNHDGLINV